MRKSFLCALILCFGLALASAAFAATNTGNVSQQGSVLIFPKVDVSGDRDTYISISNGNNLPVFIKCYWVDYLQNWQDFMFELTANQPISFSAKFGLSLDAPLPVTVPPFFDGTVGELKCWATDNSGATQTKWNFLVGSAKVVDFTAENAYEYNAWSFAARTAGANGSPVGTGGTILLDAVQYDACPNYFLGNFNAGGSNFGFYRDTDLVLVPCKEDVRQDRTPTITKAKYDIWNENEVLYSGAYNCVKCWYEGFLSKISNKFLFANLHTQAGRFRVQGMASTQCAGSVASPLIGLLVEYLDFGFGELSDQAEVAPIATTASEGFASGQATTGFIKWDTLPAPEESAAR